MANSNKTGKFFHPLSSRLSAGQAMVESIIIILITLSLLFGLLQVAHAFASREILNHAAARAARARTVGFNHWMCQKVMRVAAIPSSGKMIAPNLDTDFDSSLKEAVQTKNNGSLWDWSLNASTHSERGIMEAARIPEYLASENNERADQILDYEGWSTIEASGLGGGLAPLANQNTFDISVRQSYPLSIFVRALNDWIGNISGGASGKEHLNLKGEYSIESHYPLYLDDKGY